MRITKIILLFSLLWAAWSLRVHARELDPREERPRQQEAITKIYLPLVRAGSLIPDWLTHLNNLRSQAGLPLVTENKEWNEGIALHARYMVKNDELTHTEAPDNRWYSEEGATAGQTSNIWVTGRLETTSTSIIDRWMMAPFHGIALLDPELQQVGYGEYREEDGNIQVGAGLDVQRGLTTTLLTSDTFPIMFPADGATVLYSEMNGEEYPDPMPSCPGYTLPTGAPVYLQLGSGASTLSTGAHTLYGEGKMLPHCLLSETAYRHPDPNEQSVGRMILDVRDALVLIPRKPLTPGETYKVAIEVNGQVYQWSFTVTGSPPATPTPQP